MTLSLNQFALTNVQGQMDLQYLGSVVSAQVDAAQSGSIVAGQALKLATTAGGLPKVLAAASNSDPIWAFAARNLKDAGYAAGSNLEVAMPSSVMFMTAGAAITRGAKVQIDATNVYVNASDGVTPTIGYALDTATALGDIIRVFIQDNSATGNADRVVNVTATLAQINAGLVLIPGVAGKKITVTDYTARVVGAFASGTAVILESTNASPVLVTTLAEAGLTNGAVLLPGSSNTTLGAGFGVPLGAGDGLQVVNSGAAQTGGTSIQFTINYQQA